MQDYTITNATVVDGTGNQPYTADVVIKDGRIERIMRFTDDSRAAHVIDAKGQVLAPGFIDMHSHTDLQYLKEEPLDAKVRQGVTTELIGQDGLGVAPIEPGTLPLLSGLTAGLLGKVPAGEWCWRSFGEYLDTLDRRRLPTNAAALASHGPIRIASMGMDNRPATAGELERMRGMLGDMMASGAYGLSTGLIYPPCSYCTTDELIALCREVSPHDGIFVVHQRDEGYYLKRSFEEVTRIAREGGVHLHISHLQAYGQVNWPLMDDVLAMADRFIEEGHQVTWDRYPYLAGSTVLTAVLPDWTLGAGTAALVKNLRDRDFRARVRAEYTKGLDQWHNRSISVGWDKIVVSAVQRPENHWMEGKDCAALARATGKDPIDFVCDLLADEELAVTMISHYGSEEVLGKVLGHAQATVGSDGIYGGRPHPRLYGTYPRFLNQFVNVRRTMSLPEAIRKVTSVPASILGLRRRGQIREGWHADLVLFDPERITDTATYEEPYQYPKGISYVFVNGKPVVADGEYNGERPGRVLRRGVD